MKGFSSIIMCKVSNFTQAYCNQTLKVRIESFPESTTIYSNTYQLIVGPQTHMNEYEVHNMYFTTLKIGCPSRKIKTKYVPKIIF